MRSSWKYKYIDLSLFKLLQNYEDNKFKTHKIYSRESIILQEFVNWKFNVYNGRNFQLLIINKNMVGHKFGEFVFTKKMTSSIHKQKILKSKKLKQKNIKKKK